MKKAIDKLEARGFKLMENGKVWVVFKNYSLNRILRFNKDKRFYRIYETNTGGSVDVAWRLQEAINELFNAFDWRVSGNLVEHIMKNTKLTKEQIANGSGIHINTLTKIEKRGVVRELTLEKLENFCEKVGVGL